MELCSKKEQKDPIVEVCVFNSQKHMWMFVFKYMFQVDVLKRIPFQYKSFGAKKKIRFFVGVSGKVNVALAFETFLENENKLDLSVIAKLMTEKNITQGLITHYKIMGLMDKSKKLQEMWKKKKLCKNKQVRFGKCSDAKKESDCRVE